MPSRNFQAFKGLYGFQLRSEKEKKVFLRLIKNISLTKKNLILANKKTALSIKIISNPEYTNPNRKIGRKNVKILSRLEEASQKICNGI